MGKVFVDIGAHFGEGLVEALKPHFDFNKVICIEPSSYACERLRRFGDSRIEIFNWAAWDKPGKSKLFSAGSVGGSLFEDKPQHWNTEEEVELRDILQFFDNSFDNKDEIFLKINAEGSEYVILKRLFANRFSNWKVNSILLSIDLPKIPQLQSKTGELINFLEFSRQRYHFRSHADPSTAINRWLKNEVTTKSVNLFDWYRYFDSLPIFYVVRNLIRPLVPKRLWLSLALSFGPNRKQ
jgi:FkbM family methyltransferase